MFKSLKRSAKGAAVPHAKATAGQPTNKMPVPEHVVIPMSMHIGAPAEPVVKKGDTVMVGTVIGKAGGFVSANIYSSVSGTVQDIAPLRMVNGAMTTAFLPFTRSRARSDRFLRARPQDIRNMPVRRSWRRYRRNSTRAAYRV